MDLPAPTDSQANALSAWNAGYNVTCSACAGAGKSTMLTHVCAQKSCPTVVLAYNKQLAIDMNRLLSEFAEHATCYTFHGMCSCLFRLVTDDDDLYSLILDLEAGVVSTKALEDVEVVCIDEAQDLNDLHIRLLRVLLPHRRVFMVGDEVQMLYDHSVTDPASTVYMSQPHLHFVSNNTWKRVRLGSSHRITYSMSRAVNHVLSDDYDRIHTLRAETEAVELFTIQSCRWVDVILHALKNVVLDDVVVLCPVWRNSWPLKNLMNQISNRFGNRLPLHMHGLDPVASSTREGKLRFMSWHASKGTQCKLAIVLGVDATSRHNPLHVALTRAFHRLVIVNDVQNSHVAFHSDAIACLVEEGSVVEVVEQVRQVIAKKEDQTLKTLNLRHWCPNGRVTQLLSTAVIDVVSLPSVGEGGRFSDDVSHVVCKAVLLRLEKELNNTSQQISNSIHGVRACSAEIPGMILSGCQKKVSTTDPKHALPLDMRTLFDRSLDALNSVAHARHLDWLCVAAGLLSWSGFHHTMRQRLPIDWISSTQFSEMYERALRCCTEVSRSHGGARFDVTKSMRVGDVVMYSTCDIVYNNGTGSILICADQVTNKDRIVALCIQMLHKLRVVNIINVNDATIERLSTRDARKSEELICDYIMREVER